MCVLPPKACVIYTQYLFIYLFLFTSLQLALEDEYSIYPKVQSPLVAIYKLNALKRQCNGVFLNETHVLTAAHCVVDNSTVYFVVYQTDNGSLNPHNKVLVSEKHIHKNYNEKISGCKSDDIAILTLEKAVPNVLPVILATSQFNYSEGVINKWNPKENGNIIELSSEFIPFKIYDSDTCKKADQKKKNTYIYDNICAAANNISLEQGDTGSPLFVYNNHGEKELIALLYCGLRFNLSEAILLNSTYPAAFTTIFTHIDWIRYLASSDTETTTINSIEQQIETDHCIHSPEDIHVVDSSSTLTTIYLASSDTETTTQTVKDHQNPSTEWIVIYVVFIWTVMIVFLIISWHIYKDNEELQNNPEQHPMLQLSPLSDIPIMLDIDSALLTYV